MIQSNPYPRAGLPGASIEDVIARHGAWKVLVAALRALAASRARRRRAAAAEAALSPHLRRDIGLAPAERPPPHRQLPL